MFPYSCPLFALDLAFSTRGGGQKGVRASFSALKSRESRDFWRVYDANICKRLQGEIGAGKSEGL